LNNLNRTHDRSPQIVAVEVAHFEPGIGSSGCDEPSINAVFLGHHARGPIIPDTVSYSVNAGRANRGGDIGRSFACVGTELRHLRRHLISWFGEPFEIAVSLILR